MASRFETFSEDEILCDKLSSRTSKYQESDELGLFSVHWQVKNYFHAEFATTSKNALDKIPEMVVNCQQISY